MCRLRTEESIRSRYPSPNRCSWGTFVQQRPLNAKACTARLKHEAWFVSSIRSVSELYSAKTTPKKPHVTTYNRNETEWTSGLSARREIPVTCDLGFGIGGDGGGGVGEGMGSGAFCEICTRMKRNYDVGWGWVVFNPRVLIRKKINK